MFSNTGTEQRVQLSVQAIPLQWQVCINPDYSSELTQDEFTGGVSNSEEQGATGNAVASVASRLCERSARAGRRDGDRRGTPRVLWRRRGVGGGRDLGEDAAEATSDGLPRGRVGMGAR